MKKLIALAVAALLSSSAFAVNLYAGTVTAGSVGATQAATQGTSGAAILGLSFTQSQASAGQIGAAAGSVSPAGVIVGQGGTATTSGGTASGALGIAGATSNYGGAAANESGAVGNFGTLGIGF